MDSHLVSAEFADAIVTTAQSEMGEELRSLTYFSRSDFDQLYLRTDLERDADLNTFVGQEWRGYRNLRDSYHGSELGNYRFTLRVFENGYLIRIATDRRGVLVTSDKLGVERCERTADALLEVLDGAGE